MTSFLDRQRELSELDSLLKRAPRQPQLLAVFGRRRIGKTTLLKYWAERSGFPTFYWMARRHRTETDLRDSLARALWRWRRGQGASESGEVETADTTAPRFTEWDSLLEFMAQTIGDQPAILILDEFPYAVESDSSLPSQLQYAWDHLLKQKPIVFVLAGSHISMMVDLLGYHAPLYGRFTAQLAIDPLPYAALAEYFPTYTADERVSAYAVLGGIPAYWEQFDPDQPLSVNIKTHLFQKVGMFRSEGATLVSDLVREPRTYESILRAVATGAHTLTDIANQIGSVPSSLSPYLKRLQAMHLVERRVPTTLPPVKRDSAKQGRYHLYDPFLRFYYRFIDPHLESIDFDEEVDRLWEALKEQFRAFVGATTFEELCRAWLRLQGRSRALPFIPEIVGSHWSAETQIDVVAINWREQAILLGECKWGAEPVRREVIRELVEKTPRVVPGEGWQVYYAFFARSGFTEAARQMGESLEALLIDLPTLDADLRRGLKG